VSITSKNSDSLGCVHEQAVGETDHLLEPRNQKRGDGHEADDFADRSQPVEFEIDSYQQDREQAERGCGPRKHGHHRPPRQLRVQQRVHDALERRHFDLDAREALHHGDVAKRVGGGLGKVGIIAFDRALHRLGLVHDQPRQPGENETQGEQRQSEPPIEHQRCRQQNGDEDKSGEMLAKERQPQPPQRVGAGEHDFQLPTRMSAGVVGERQLQNMLEEIRQNEVAAPVR
jgi:hypothetical protein